MDCNSQGLGSVPWAVPGRPFPLRTRAAHLLLCRFTLMVLKGCMESVGKNNSL